MIWLLFTILDLATAAVVLLSHLGILSTWRALFTAGVYLIGKGIVFRGSFLSILDILAGLYILMMILGLHTAIAYVIIGYLLYKVLMFFILSGPITGGSGS